MILKGSQRGGATQMGLHLMNGDTNDHVEVHEIRGFIATNLVDALREAYAISRGSKCTKFMYSLSLSPPQNEIVSIAAFEEAIDEIEAALALKGHARVVVFHEKSGRRHAHCVWSRINPRTIIAQPISHDRLKLKDISRRLYLKHGWQLPPGLAHPAEISPFNYGRVEWLEATRVGREPIAVKKALKDCWAVSDSRKAFCMSLEEKGYFLARGDKRGHVVVDWRGDTYSLSRWINVNTKTIRAKLGDPDDLHGVEDVQKLVSGMRSHKQTGFIAELKREFGQAIDNLGIRRTLLVERHRIERSELKAVHDARRVEEAKERAKRFRVGLRGLWDRITGRTAAIRRDNERELTRSEERDREEKQALVVRQLDERRELQRQISAQKALAEKEFDRFGRELSSAKHQDLVRYGRESDEIAHPLAQRLQP